MRITTSKSKNAESFYISKGFINDQGVSTSTVVRKLGTLQELLKVHGPTREDVMRWAKEEARLETLRYKQEKATNEVQITFHAKKSLPYGEKRCFHGGYIFLQWIYYGMSLHKTCRKLKNLYHIDYDLNAIFSDLIYTRVLDPKSKRSSYEVAQKLLEAPSYELHHLYRALDILGKECDFIQAEVYKNSKIFSKRNDKILYYDCTNYYFEIEQENGSKRYGKSKEHRPNPIIQMGLFMDGDGLPLAFSLFPGNANEQTSLKPLEQKVLSEFGCQQFIYCSDAGLASEDIRAYNHMGKKAYIVTQSIKKLPREEREWALSPEGFRRLQDDIPVCLENIPEGDTALYYKEEPYSTKRLHQRLIVTYSPKYAAYQKSIREKQVLRAAEMVEQGKIRKQRQNPNDPARFIQTISMTPEGEIAKPHSTLDMEKIAAEADYDGLYAVCTDLLEDNVQDILKVSEGRWQIEECFRMMKTDFAARPIYLQNENRIKAHFLVCFLALLVYRQIEKKLNHAYTCQEILSCLKEMNFASVEQQGFYPLYERTALTDDLHSMTGFRTDYHFLTKSTMKNILKKSKETLHITQP